MRALQIQPHSELRLPSLPSPELDRDLQIQAYSAWLGFNAQYVRQMFRSRQQYVHEANKYAKDVLGWAEDSGSPPLSPRTARNLNIHGLDGVNAGRNDPGWDGQRSPSRSRSPSHRPSWGEHGSSDGAFRRPRSPPRQDTRSRSWQQREDTSDGGFAHHRRLPHQDTRSRLWQQREDTSDGGFTHHRRSPGQDNGARSSYRRF